MLWGAVLSRPVLFGDANLSTLALAMVLSYILRYRVDYLTIVANPGLELVLAPISRSTIPGSCVYEGGRKSK